MANEKKTGEIILMLAEQSGAELARQLDTYTCAEPRPEVQRKIETMIYKATRRRWKKKTALLVAACLLCASLLGALALHKLPFSLLDSGTHSLVVPALPEAQLQESGLAYIIGLPEGYRYSSVNSLEGSVKVVFSSGEDALIFTQSKVDLSLNPDTENAAVSTVILHNGHEGVYIEKNGATLIWQQGDYYFMLYATDEAVDLLAVASSLQKI